MEESDRLLDEFLNHLTVEKGLSKNTIEAYSRDIIKYFTFLEKADILPLKPLKKASLKTLLRHTAGILSSILPFLKRPMSSR